MTDLDVAPSSGPGAGDGDAAGPSVAPGAKAAAQRRGRVRRVAMKPRGALVKAHRWLSFVLLAWLVVIAATGTVLVLRDHLEHWTRGDLYAHGSGDLGAEAALQSAKAVMPEDTSIYGMTLPANGSGVYFVGFQRPKGPAPADPDAEPPMAYYRAYVDPATARVNGVRNEDAGFLPWTLRMHENLLQDNGLFGVDAPGKYCDGPSGALDRGVCTVIPGGEDMIAWFAVGWMIVLSTGFYLWYWPGVKRWARAVRVRRGRGAFTFSLDLHKAVGLVVVVPLFVVAFTGAAFSFPYMKDAFEKLTPAKHRFELWTPPDDAAVSATPADGATPITTDAAIAAVKQAHPDWRVDFVSPPADETGIYMFWVDKGFSTWTAEGGGGNTMINVDQYSGQLVYTGTPEDGNVFDQAWDDWSFPLHSGDFGGEPTRILWIFVALSPIVLGTTGVAMNRIRAGKRKRRGGPGPKPDAGSAATGASEPELDRAGATPG